MKPLLVWECVKCVDGAAAVRVSCRVQNQGEARMQQRLHPVLLAESLRYAVVLLTFEMQRLMLDDALPQGGAQ